VCYFLCTATAVKTSSRLSPDVIKIVLFYPCILEMGLQPSIVFAALVAPTTNDIYAGHNESRNHRINSKKNLPFHVLKACRRTTGTSEGMQEDYRYIWRHAWGLQVHLNACRRTTGTSERIQEDYRYSWTHEGLQVHLNACRTTGNLKECRRTTGTSERIQED